ncbi:MAG: hypothetical protein U0703_23635 [Anaerolineae bacterium]
MMQTVDIVVKRVEPVCAGKRCGGFFTRIRNVHEVALAIGEAIKQS